MFDNCEHVLDAAADLIEAILATRRPCESWPPAAKGWESPTNKCGRCARWTLSGGIDSAAVTLFIERAHSVAPRFSMATPDRCGAVVEICRRLDGIPLAIELAASRMASMTASEMRDRLDHRFRLLVGSRRGLERHQTLRHAVAGPTTCSTTPERVLLDRCSVFAGGFDLESACAVADSMTDEYAILDRARRPGARVADRRPTGLGTDPLSMLETIRQFAEEQLVTRDDAEEVRIAHARHYAQRMHCPVGQPAAARGIHVVHRRTGQSAHCFRWAADHGDLDVAATIATSTTLLGFGAENYEPIAWAEELIEPACAVDHPRLAALYVTAAQCWQAGRLEEAIRYSDAGQLVFSGGRDEVPYGIQGWLGSAYLAIGQPERTVEWGRASLHAVATPIPSPGQPWSKR